MEILQYNDWASSCGRKRRYSRAAHARMCIGRILKLGEGLGMETLNTYRCRFCGGFHIGHSRCNRQSLGSGGRQI